MMSVTPGRLRNAAFLILVAFPAIAFAGKKPQQICGPGWRLRRDAHRRCRFAKATPEPDFR